MTGSELRSLRRKQGVSIYAVAKAIGVAPGSVSRWETGARSIHPAFARLLRLYFLGRLGRATKEATVKPHTERGGGIS